MWVTVRYDEREVNLKAMAVVVVPVVASCRIMTPLSSMTCKQDLTS